MDFRGQMTLTYDMTFAIILLTSLYETETKTEQRRCKVHPVKKQTMRRNEITEYAADMNLLLAYYHLEDDWADEKKPAALAGKGVLRKKADRIIRKISTPEPGDQKRRCGVSESVKKKTVWIWTGSPGTSGG